MEASLAKPEMQNGELTAAPRFAYSVARRRGSQASLAVAHRKSGV
jgi:hypothetical protein